MKIKLKERIYIDTGNSQLYLHYSINGKRYRDPLDIHINAKDSKAERNSKLEEGEEVRRNKERDLSHNKHGLYNPSRARTSFYAYLDNYIETHGNKGKNTGMRFQLKQYHKEDISFEAVTTEFVQGYYEHVKKHTGSDTPNMYLSCLRTVLRAAVKEKFIQHNPSLEIEFTFKSDPQVKKEIPTPAEMRRLEKTKCKIELVKRAAIICSRTGFGAAELKTIYGRNVDKRLMQVTAYRQKNKGRGLMPITIPITAATLKLFKGHEQRRKQLFPLPYKNEINKAIKKWVWDADIDKHITFYCFRHYYATSLLEAGASDTTIERGGVSRRQISGYTRADDTLRKIINNIGK